MSSQSAESDMSVRRKLVALLAADIAGNRRLTILDEQGTIQRLGQLFSVARNLVSARRGRVVSTAGDGFLAEFPSALDSAFAAYVTRAVRDHLRDKTAIEFEDLGERELKNLPRPVRMFRIMLDRLPDIPPPLATPKEDGEEDEASRTELASWESIGESESAGDYQAYLDKYPDGHLAEIARRRAS